MDAIISDTTGKTIAKEQSYKVDVFSRGNSVHLELDCEMNEQLNNLLSLAIQNGRKWYQLKQNSETKKWSKIPVEQQPLI